MVDAKSIAVIGGGPAGARTAELLAMAGHKVVLFEEKPGWEKPCGGGLTHKALLRYPFLQDTEVDRHWVESCEMISPLGRRVNLELGHTTAIFSRRVLNGMLLDRARRAGAEVIGERATAISRNGLGWELRSRTSVMRADFVVLATGARNPFHAQFDGALAAGDFMTAVGYYVPGSSSKMTVRFFPSFEGYAWLFPRCDHYSAGICGRLRGQTTAQMRTVLENFLNEEGLAWQQSTFYAHILPAPRTSTFEKMTYCGQGWAAVGDAAGLVDPVTGEGLYYALRSADLLHEAFAATEPERYSAKLRAELLPDLLAASRYAHRFYWGSFLAGAVTERMVQMAQRSSTMRAIIRDLFLGLQGYTDLDDRVYSRLPRVLLEYSVSFLSGKKGMGDAEPRASHAPVASD
jgi:flavin-dependent dehydrogenase